MLKKAFLNLLLIPSLLLLFTTIVTAANSEHVSVSNIKGMVQVKSVGTDSWKKAADLDKLNSGDKIRSFLESSALLTFPDKSEFTLGENSSLDIKDISKNPKTYSSKRELKLELGSLHYKVQPKEQTAAEFKIHSSTSIVGITGTEGHITANGDDKPTENILIEGSTYNTDEYGNADTYQEQGNTYINDGDGSDMYSGDAQKDAADAGGVNEEILSLLKDLISRIEAKQSEGYAVGHIDHLIDQAFESLENRDYDRVKEIISEANKMLEEAHNLEIPQELQQKIDDLITQVESKEEGGYDVAELYILMEKIPGLLEEGDLEEVENIIVLVSQKMESLVLPDEGEDNGGVDFLSQYQHAQELLLEKEASGFAMDEVKSLLRQSYVFYESGDLAKAFELLDQVNNLIDHTLKEMPETLQAKIEKAVSDIDAKKSEGFDTSDLELLIDEIMKLIEDDAFIKIKDLVKQIEDGLLTLIKTIPTDWEVKLTQLKEEIDYKKSLGYDLSNLSDLLQSLDGFVNDADILNIEIIYDQIVTALKNLGLPAGFEEDWNSFLAKLDEKIAEEFDVKDVIALKDKAQAAIDQGDINLARDFLEKAKEKLLETEDTEPPSVQVLIFEETVEKITVEGVATDNTKIKSISVNNSQIEFSEDGKFTYTTIPSADLESLIITAIDIAENTSPPITLAITIEHDADTAPVQTGQIMDATIEYGTNTFTVSGKFISGGKVTLNETEVYCDNTGSFTAEIAASTDIIEKGVAIIGTNSDGSSTDTINLTVKDKWAPVISVSEVYFSENVAPTLNVDPLEYTDQSVAVSGMVTVKLMANISGIVSDIGSGINKLTVSGREMEVDDQSKFLASFALAEGETSSAISAVDNSGNSSEDNVAFDAEFPIPVIKINDTETALSADGKFNEELSITKDLTEIQIVLLNSEGEQITSQSLPVANILPPDLEVSDIIYSQDQVTINGNTDPNAEIKDSTGLIISDHIKASEAGIFSIIIDVPTGIIEGILVASNIEGKESEPVAVKIDPPKDENAPILFVSYPEYSGKNIIVRGSAEDDTGIASITVNGLAIEILDGDRFDHTLEAIEGLESIEIIAQDASGNSTSEIFAIRDSVAPIITIDQWAVVDGMLVIKGKAQDNVAVKEVRLNEMPLVLGDSEIVEFYYEGVLTEDSHDARIIAVDMFDNVSTEGPREIEIPVDTTPPTGDSISMEYGSPVVFVSGKVNDPGGIKAVYVNDEPIDTFADGSFNVKIDIEVLPPKITLETPSYDAGKVTLSGKVAMGDFNPGIINVTSEDLAGNLGTLFKQKVEPYKLSEINVFVDGKLVDVDDLGNFTREMALNFGQSNIEIKAVDPFENEAIADAGLEANAPVLDLSDLQYNNEDKTVFLSGKADDTESGLYTVTVNGIRVDFDDAGNFTHKASINENSLGVAVSDYIGNTTSLNKDVTPPDFWPPLFAVEITPVPAIVGSPVYVDITTVDSQTSIPETLIGPPIVTANVDGVVIDMSIEGEGSKFIATLQTTDIDPALVTIHIEGTDLAGNTSSEIDGADVFTLVGEDSITPSFTIDASPSPLVLGEASQVKVFASEELKELPVLEAVMPSGAAISLSLNKVSTQEFESDLTVSLDEIPGVVSIKLTGGTDLSDNMHDTTESTIDVTAPVQNTEIPLNIDLIEFMPDRFSLRGSTASEAVVRVEAGKHTEDLIADVEGKFEIQQPVTPSELTEMLSMGPTIKVRVKAHNYAGFESPTRVFELDIPEATVVPVGNFMIMVNPPMVEQGSTINIDIESTSTVTGDEIGIIYLPDGRRLAVPLNGSGNRLNGRFEIDHDVPLGRAMFEIVSGTVRENMSFEIVMSAQWMQRLNKDDFYKIRVMPDPLIIGKEAEFIVDTMGDLNEAPKLVLDVNGNRTDIPLGGGPRNFSGRYVVPADAISGRAELILNPGTPEEVRRPCGIEDDFIDTGDMQAFLFSNPNPLIAGAGFDVKAGFPMDVNFKPQLVLRLNNGDGIDIPLDGDAPSQQFSARVNLRDDAVQGLANFVLKDDTGAVLQRFPTSVSPSFKGASGVDIFVMPDMMKKGDTATIQVTSTSNLQEPIEAHVNFSDGSKKVVRLGVLDMMAKGDFVVSETSPIGMVSISVFDGRRDSLGSARAEITSPFGGGGFNDSSSGVRIFLDNPEFMPGDNVGVDVEANLPFDFQPKARLEWDGGTVNITLQGSVPGNRFNGNFKSPADEIERGRIEVLDDQGYMIGELFIEGRRRHDGGDGEIDVTPFPPVVGQPLAVTVKTPEIIDFAPMARLVYESGSQDLNLYGPVPGQRFSGSVGMLEQPLIAIEIIDDDGTVVERIPFDIGPGPDRHLDFKVEFVGDKLDPGETGEVQIFANNSVPFVPRLSVEFGDGSIVDVPVSGVPFDNQFSGKFTVPSTADLSNITVFIYDQQGNIIDQFQMGMTQGETGGSLVLNVRPAGEDGIDASWDYIRGARGFVLRYGETEALGQKVEIRGETNHFVDGLTAGTKYFFEVTAYAGREIEITRSSIVSATVGMTRREMFIQAVPMGNQINLMWNDYPQADGYSVSWGEAPASLSYG